MSNSLGVATATRTLSFVLTEALGRQGGEAVPGAVVTTLRPDKLETGPAQGINLFLYQVSPNAYATGDDLPNRRADGTLTNVPAPAFDLDYLVSFSGDDAEQEPQRLLGLTLGTLMAEPLLSRGMVRAAIDNAKAQAPGTYLQHADLAEQQDTVRVTLTSLDLEEMSRLWSTFVQTPYRLSVTIRATLVRLDGPGIPRSALPVRKRNLAAASFRAPVITRVIANGDVDAPVKPGATLRIEGSGLSGARTRVSIRSAWLADGVRDTVEVTPAPDQATDTNITIELPDAIAAGIRGVQVRHFQSIGEPPEDRLVAESNLAAIVLSPIITEQPTIAAGVNNAIYVTVSLDPPVERRQRVVLLLNERGTPAGRPPRGYVFQAPRRDDPTLPESVEAVIVPTRGVLPGVYLVRVHVDGASSALEVGADGTYATPALAFD